MYVDVIGPLPLVRGGAKYIHCIVDKATRIATVNEMKTINFARIIDFFEAWIKLQGRIRIVLTDSVVHSSSDMMSN